MGFGTAPLYALLESFGPTPGLVFLDHRNDEPVHDYLIQRHQHFSRLVHCASQQHRHDGDAEADRTEIGKDDEEKLAAVPPVPIRWRRPRARELLMHDEDERYKPQQSDDSEERPGIPRGDTPDRHMVV